MGTIRHHGDAAECLRYAVLGAHVDVTRPPAQTFTHRDEETQSVAVEKASRQGRYVIDLHQLGPQTGCVVGSYELPCDATKLADDARRRVHDAIRERDRRSISERSEREWHRT